MSDILLAAIREQPGDDLARLAEVAVGASADEGAVAALRQRFGARL
jgi:hypothetical protein